MYRLKNHRKIDEKTKKILTNDDYATIFNTLRLHLTEYSAVLHCRSHGWLRKILCGGQWQWYGWDCVQPFGLT